MNTHETVFPAFKGSLMRKVNVELVDGIVGMGMWFMGGPGGQYVNDVILRSRHYGAAMLMHHRGRGWLQYAFTWDKCVNKLEAVYLWSW